MNRRIFKKRYKNFLDNFTKTKIPLAFKNEQERKQYISLMSRKRVNQKYMEAL